MRGLIDAAYLATAMIAAPFWIPARLRTGKLRTAWRARLGHVSAGAVDADRPRILVHAVSVGEVNAVRQLVERLHRTPLAPQVIVSTTTDTGMARAQAIFGADHDVVRFPLDFSWAVDRFLDVVQPDAVALIELEVWPNFAVTCERRGIPVCVVNGRLSHRSFTRYRRIRPVVAPMFRRLRLVAAQHDDYARRFRALGATDVVVTGTMKWDAAAIEPDRPASSALAEAMGIATDRPLVVAGSTAPGEHELLHASVPDGVQLLCAPRRPEWFDQAARALPGCARRSAGDRGSATGRFLLDTIGELRDAYALADVVVVGRSFGDLHGSDMMEPVSLGKPVVVGPSVADFTETVAALLAERGIVQVTPSALPGALVELIADRGRREALVEGARRTIEQHRGATDRNAGLILKVMAERLAGRAAAG